MNEYRPGPSRQTIAGPVARLIEAFHRLPGIGPKSAQRLTFYLLRAPEPDARRLAEALVELRERIVFCSVCQNVTEHDPCSICTDPQRDRATICVVEEPLDVLAIERSGSHSGLYHVLHGVLSPVEGVGPDNIKLNELTVRLQNGSVREVIMATNPNLEGEATALYVSRLLGSSGIRVTRLARGLPTGADLEYADDQTLARALENRQDV